MVAFEWGPLSGLWEFLECSVPNILILFFDWGAFDSLTIMAGYLGLTELATAALLMNFLCIGDVIVRGIWDSATANIGNMLGEGRPRRAIIFGKVSILLTVTLSACFVTVIYSLRTVVPQMYTLNPKIVHLTSLCMLPLLILTAINNMINNLIAISRGMGRQGTVSIVNFVTMWLVGIPLAYILAFKMGHSLTGLYVGLSVGGALNVACMAITVSLPDWDKLAEEIAEGLSMDAE